MFNPPWRHGLANPRDGKGREGIVRQQTQPSRQRSRSQDKQHVPARPKLPASRARTLWMALSPSIRTQLADNFPSLESVAGTARFDRFAETCEDTAVVSTMRAIHLLLTNESGKGADNTEWLYASARLGLKASHVSTQVHKVLQKDVEYNPSKQGPTPRSNIRMLQDHKLGGGDPSIVLDAVFTARTVGALADATHQTYASHLRMISWACDVLGVSPLPASLLSIQRITAIVNDASTLRGWLAAWKSAHELVGQQWLGDADPRLRMARVGLARLTPPSRPRKRARRSTTISLIKWALRQNSRRFKLWAGVAAVAYIFGFRVPSEVLRQWRPGQASFTLKRQPDGSYGVLYGPFLRKGRPHPTTIFRKCLCDAEKLLCPHLWCQAIVELDIHSAEEMSGPEFNNKLQRGVAEALSASDAGYALDWTSHAFRRGSAVDILETQGVQAMMRHGEWGSEKAAHAYASLDEITSQHPRTACTVMPDLSDDDR